MDILGTGKLTKSGNKYILVIVDKLMRYCLLEAIPNQEAEMVMKVFAKAMLRMGFLRLIFTDCSTQFTSQLATGLAKTFGITRVYTSKFNPQSDSKLRISSERFSICSPRLMNRLLLMIGTNICPSVNSLTI